MIRNLLYAIFIHLFIFFVIYANNLKFFEGNSSVDKAFQINFVDEEFLNNIKTSEKQDENIARLSAKEKFNLYNKIKNKEFASSNSNSAGKRYMTKSQIKTKKKTKQISQVLKNNFSFKSKPKYIAKKRLREKQIKEIEERNKKEAELRKKIIESKKQETDNMSIDDIFNKYKDPIIINEDNINQTNLYNGGDEANSNEVVLDSNIKMDTTNINKDNIFSSKDIDNLRSSLNQKEGEKLSMREQINIRRQIKSCYQRAIVESGKDSRAIVSLVVKLERNGSIDMRSVVVDAREEDNKGLSKSAIEISIENGKTALIFCSPIRNLPKAKYSVWKYMNFEFDSNQF